MEDRRPSWEESKKDDKEKTTTPIPGEGFLAYLARLRQQEVERQNQESEEDEDDEETEGGKKKNRLRRLFNKLFGSIAPVEKIGSASASTTEGRQTASESDLPEAENTEPPSAQDEFVLDLPKVPNERVSQSIETPIAPEVPRSIEEQTEPAVMPEVLYERSAEIPTSKPAPEQAVIDRRVGWGPAILTGLTVDQLSRHRDRKLKREDQRIKREVQQLNHNMTVTKNITRQLEQLAQGTNKEMETVKSRTQQFERRLGVIQPAVEQIDANNQAGKAPEKLRHLPERPIEYQAKLPEISPEVTPIVVLQEVETAAERNVPLEASLEKRHEIKDEDAVSQQFGATSVGKVLADLHQQTTHQHAAFSQTLQDRTKLSSNLPVNPMMYKQAAQSGFWAGMAIAVTLIIMAVV